jgi:hypothetical protein
MIDLSLRDLLSDCTPISLEETAQVSLLNRSDTKYVFPSSALADVVRRIGETYRVLTIDGCNLFRYANMYFDTPDRLFYHQHHNGKLNRYKIRSRRYVESGNSFFEVKLKLNGRRTHKERIPHEDDLSVIGTTASEFIRTATGMDSAVLAPVLAVHYTRMTFVHRVRCERVTIDTSLWFENGQQRRLDGVIIAEVKQDRLSRESDFIKLMQERRLAPLSISKYCIGTALTCTDIKLNRFKPKLRTLQKVCYGTD